MKTRKILQFADRRNENCAAGIDVSTREMRSYLLSNCSAGVDISQLISYILVQRLRRLRWGNTVTAGTRLVDCRLGRPTAGRPLNQTWRRAVRVFSLVVCTTTSQQQQQGTLKHLHLQCISLWVRKVNVFTAGNFEIGTKLVTATVPPDLQNDVSDIRFTVKKRTTVGKFFPRTFASVTTDGNMLCDWEGNRGPSEKQRQPSAGFYDRIGL